MDVNRVLGHINGFLVASTRVDSLASFLPVAQRRE
jgi:hypothetical protein